MEYNFSEYRKLLEANSAHLWDLKSAVSAIKFRLGNSNVDEHMLNIADLADRVIFSAGRMNMFFSDEANAENAFKKLARLWGAKTKNQGNMKFFKGDGGFSGELVSLGDYTVDQVLESLDTLDESLFGKQSWIELVKQGWARTSRKEVKDIMNDPLMSEAYDMRQFRDNYGSSIWFKGPSKISKVFATREEAEAEYTSLKGTYIDKPSAYYTKEDVKEIKRDGAIIWIKKGKSIDEWELLVARKLNDF